VAALVTGGLQLLACGADCRGKKGGGAEISSQKVQLGELDNFASRDHSTAFHCFAFFIHFLFFIEERNSK
jgi:hypothetical protein